MNKKIRSVLLLVMLAVFCLVLFTGCQVQKVDFFDPDKDLSLVGQLVRWMHGWIGNYGWTVVVFTVFLKLIMLPLDFWQRYSSRKSAVKMQKMQPIIESIDKRYGANTQRANEEKRKLYSKQGYSMASMCLPMIISMVVFFVMFAGLRNYSTYSSIQNFKALSDEYYNVYEQTILNGDDEGLKVKYQQEYDENYNDAIANGSDEYIADLTGKIYGKIAAVDPDAEQAAIKAVQDLYMETHESWLWIQNVWQPDTWEAIMPEFNSGTNSFTATVTISYHPDGNNGADTYNVIRKAVLAIGERGTEGKWNGLMILPILSIGLSFLSMFISQQMEKKNRKGQVVAQDQQQAATNKTMMIIMPLMMAFFGFMYTGAFAIYMVCNYTISTISTVALRVPVEKFVEKRIAKEDEKNNTSKAKYMR